MTKSNIDDNIKTICNTIDDNIKELADSNVNLLSQNIISQLRNLVEHVAVKIYIADCKTITYDDIQTAISALKGDGKLKWLRQFHAQTQKSVSHYSPDGEGARRLMQKYYEKIVKKIKSNSNGNPSNYKGRYYSNSSFACF